MSRPFPEDSILYETANLYAIRCGDAVEIRLHNGTHSLVAGRVGSEEQARRFIDRAERYPAQLRAFVAGARQR